MKTPLCQWVKGCSAACWLRWGIGAAVLVVVSLAAAAGWRSWSVAQASRATAEGIVPRIEPDYSGIIIPPNLCPLNFKIAETGAWFYAEARGKAGTPVKVLSHGPGIVFPETGWRQLLAANIGEELRFEIGRKRADGTWQRFAAITNYVAKEPIDSHLIYRKIHPAHNTWSKMGIYQRDLTSYAESPILENKSFGNECCHCHSVWNNDPTRLSLDIRSPKYGNSFLLLSNAAIAKIGGTVGFTAWHPNGRMAVCSFSQPRFLLHSARGDMREIVDLDGTLGCLVDGDSRIKSIPGINDRRLTTFPAWSPDGRFLYYSSATNLWKIPGKTRNENYQEVKYDLMRISFDPEKNQWGEPEMVVPSQITGMSAVQCRVSPDGRWLTFVMCSYGCWPVYHADSDLYAVDLRAAHTAGKFTWQRLEINTAECESWHAWSSNGRWLVLNSKRGNPLLGRPYLVHVDDAGRFSKPLAVPQRDPDFYGSCLTTFTMPSLLTGPVAVDKLALANAIKSPAPHAFVLPARSSSDPLPEKAHPAEPIDDGAGSQQ